MNNWHCPGCPGWDGIMEALERTVAYIFQCDRKTARSKVDVSDIKEKFGTLRFYHDGDDQIDAAATMAEEMSAITCQRCGKPGEARNPHGWISTLCKECYENPRPRTTAEAGD